MPNEQHAFLRKGISTIFSHSRKSAQSGHMIYDVQGIGVWLCALFYKLNKPQS